MLDVSLQWGVNLQDVRPTSSTSAPHIARHRDNVGRGTSTAKPTRSFKDQKGCGHNTGMYHSFPARLLIAFAKDLTSDCNEDRSCLVVKIIAIRNACIRILLSPEYAQAEGKACGAAI